MNRFLRISLVAAALSSFASATVITMNSTAAFTGGLDLQIGGADVDTTTRLTGSFFPAGATGNLINVGDVDWLPLGTLQIAETIRPGDSTPNITADEYDDGYQLAVDVNTNLGLLNFLVTNAAFTLNFSPGATDADTTDATREIQADFAGTSQIRVDGLTTILFSIVSNNYSDNGLMSFNQDGDAQTLWLRAEVLRVDQPGGEVPEPSSMAMMGAGLLGVGLLARRFKAA